MQFLLAETRDLLEETSHDKIETSCLIKVVTSAAHTNVCSKNHSCAKISQPEDVKYARASPERSTSPSYVARCQRSESPPPLSSSRIVGGISATDCGRNLAGGDDSSTSGDHMGEHEK